MDDETTSFLAQSRTFQISAKSGEVVEINLLGLSTPVDKLTNTTVDSKYKILELLGEGGMGAVYRARHLMLDKDIALKTVRSNKSSAQAIERFNREVRAVAKLDHPNIVHVFDSGITEANQPYYTMELLIGQSLEDRLKEAGSISIDEALAIFSEVAEGLKSAHNNGIVHRDLKPANIFLSKLSNQSSKRSSAKVVDFGIAKLAGNSANMQDLTLAGLVFGSPLYMSPEQSRGEEVDKRSDIYSFGCALYETLTGRPPLVGAHAFETMLLHQTTTPPRLTQQYRGQTFPPMLESFVGRLLNKNPDHRPQSFEEILETFRRIRKLKDVETGAVAAIPAKAQKVADEPSPVAQGSVFTKPLILSLAALVLIGLSIGALLLFSKATIVPAPSNAPKIQFNSVSPATTPETSMATSRATSSETSTAPSTASKPGPDSSADGGDQFSLLLQSSAVKLYPARPITIERGAKAYDDLCHEISPENFDVFARSTVTNLNLRRCKFDNNLFSKLSPMRLAVLEVPISNFDDSGAAALVNCKYLLKLEADGTAITNEGCRSLSKCKSLMELELSRTQITDKALSYLEKLPRLTDLILNSDKVTILGVTHLCQLCTTLKKLDVTNCRQLTMDQLRFLRSHFPHITILADDEKTKEHSANTYFNSQR